MPSPTVNGIFQDGCFSCGFDMDPTAIQIFDQSTNGSAQNGVTPGPRGGTGYAWSVLNLTVGKNLLVNLTTLIEGHAYICSAYPTTSSIIATWFDVTANAAQVTLRLFNDGHLQFFLGTGTGTALGSASATGLVALSTWVYLETKVKIDPSAGTVDLRVNGASAISASTLNTRSTANTWVSAFQFNGFNVGTFQWVDDWYMLDTTGASPNNTFLGSVQVKGDKPSANSTGTGGAHGNQFTHTNPQNDNHLNAGNIPANVAQYNSDSTPGDYDMFQFPSVSAQTIYFVNYWAQTTLDAAGSRTVSIDAYLSSTDFTSAAFSPPVTPSVKLGNLVCVKDPTGTAWTTTTAASAEAGLTVVS